MLRELFPYLVIGIIFAAVLYVSAELPPTIKIDQACETDSECLDMALNLKTAWENGSRVIYMGRELTYREILNMINGG
jgi:hypothetical protein